MRVPVKTWAMLEPVLRSPARKRSNHGLRPGCATAPASVVATGAGATATGSVIAFFLKKLNIEESSASTPGHH